MTRHGITPQEVEEAMSDPRRKPTKAYTSRGERRQAVIGATKSGRLITVVYTMRSGRFRPFSAQPGKRKEQKIYEKER
ncbi:MAG: BrnT family toxin [Dehalococcoidia bacterium]